jgi:hypothetical protein
MEASMNARIFYAVAPLAVLLSAGANAQSVITTERPLDLTQSQQTTVYRTIVRESAVPQTRNTVTRKQSKQIIRKPSGNVVRTTTTERIVTRPSRAVAAPVAQQQVITQPQTTTLVTADPLDLTQDQRTVVYRTLAQPSLQAAPVVTERLVPPPAPRPYVTTEPVVTAPQFEQRVITVPQTTGVGTVVTEPVATEIVIGSRIPASVPLYAMPAAAAATAPSIGGYQYALIGDRVYLVDPRDGIVVAMLYQ